MTANAATPTAAQLSSLLGLRCFGCGVAGFTYQRGQDVRAWCRRCWFRRFGPKEPTIMEWLNATQPAESHVGFTEPQSFSKNTVGSAHGAIAPTASQRTGWAGTHNQDSIT